jgi:ribosomal protein S21
MSEIVIGDNDRLEWALKAFRRKVQKSGVLKGCARNVLVKPNGKRLKSRRLGRRDGGRGRGD